MGCCPVSEKLSKTFQSFLGLAHLPRSFWATPAPEKPSAKLLKKLKTQHIQQYNMFGTCATKILFIMAKTKSNNGIFFPLFSQSNNILLFKITFVGDRFCFYGVKTMNVNGCSNVKMQPRCTLWVLNTMLYIKCCFNLGDGAKTGV